MLVRIVKMSFVKASIPDFLANFEANKEKIRNFPGCQLLVLYQDKTDSDIFFTYSYWTNESDLENYRKSDLFKGIWKKTKVLFSDKPEAWSLDEVDSIN